MEWVEWAHHNRERLRWDVWWNKWIPIIDIPVRLPTPSG